MSYRNLIQEILLTHQERLPDAGTLRHIDFSALPKKASVFMGSRRSGKSTFLYQIMHRIVSNGLPIENLVYLNFFDERIIDLKAQELGQILDAYYALFANKRRVETVYFFFDEIQEIVGWESFVSRLLESENCEVYITGSSSKMLSKEIATQMRGRSLNWEIFPFSFVEFLDHLDVTYSKITSQVRLNLETALNKYLECGGFPEVTELEPNLRIAIHQEYYKTLIHRDIIERNDASQPKLVLQLTRDLITSVASLYTLNKLTEKLKSQGF